MFDTEKFIMCVQKEKAIWKKSSKLYSNKNAKQEAWRRISMKMFSNWEYLHENERNEKEFDIIKKWKNLKDTFVKELKYEKSEKTGPLAKKKKTYIYFKNLQFLLPELENKRSDSNVKNNLPEISDDNQYQYDEGEYSSLPEQILRPRKNNCTTFENKLLQLLSEENTKNKDVDEDELFFKSLLPNVKKLNDNQKLQFKINVMNTLQSALNEATVSIQAESYGNVQNIHSIPQEHHYFPRPSSMAPASSMSSATGYHSPPSSSDIPSSEILADLKIENYNTS